MGGLDGHYRRDAVRNRPGHDVRPGRGREAIGNTNASPSW